MKTDGVAAAFELIVEEIEAVASEITTQGTQAFRDKAYDIAQQLGESGKSLQSFRAKVTDLLEEWQSGIDVTTRQRFSTPRPKQTRARRTHTKGPRTRLRVTFDGGPTIEEYYAADTFALALKRMGFDRVVALGIKERNVPLVGDIKSDQYGQRRVDGKYVCTHSSTPEKKETLERVAKRLGVSLKVEIM
jgi:hypothetical protein